MTKGLTAYYLLFKTYSVSSNEEIVTRFVKSALQLQNDDFFIKLHPGKINNLDYCLKGLSNGFGWVNDYEFDDLDNELEFLCNENISYLVLETLNYHFHQCLCLIELLRSAIIMGLTIKVL